MIDGSDRDFTYRGEASEINLHISQAERAIGAVERTFDASDHLLQMSYSRKEIPESLQKALAFRRDELELLRGTLLSSMQSAGEAIKRMDTIPPLFLERYKAVGGKIVALKERFDATCEELDAEMGKPIEVVDDDS